MAIVNAEDLESETVERGETRFERTQLAAAAGGERIGCSRYDLPPGRRAWPYHYHAGNEEAIYVLSGTGTLRHEDGTATLEAGDYVALPAGESGAHRVVNDGDDPLRYLVISTMDDPDVTVYPDSEKIGVYAGSAPGGPADERSVHGYYRIDDDVDYWAGEEPDEE
jgi:uncharacterized cupin superfamily protein